MPIVPRHLKPRPGCGSNQEALPRPEPPREIIRHCLRNLFGSLLKLGAVRVEPHFSQHRPAALAWWLSLAFALSASADGVRLRDLVEVSGVRDNQLVGYGLVAGLAGEGDKDPVYTKQTVANMLMRYGITIPAATISAKNVAVVMVTAEIPAFFKPGARIDVTVASMGDAKTLQGGVLLQTPLLGADNKVYAVAQGAVSIGGFTAGGGGSTTTKNHPTTAQIVNGALVEKEVPSSVIHDKTIELLLREPSFTVASRMATAINNIFTNSAQALDTTSVRITLPEESVNSPVDFLARLEAIEVQPDAPARIIINERTGTIVATSTIRISNCAVSHGNISVNIATTREASQPTAFSNTGKTKIVRNTATDVTEQMSQLIPLPESTTVDKVAASLNALGVTPRDMMAIFEAMKQAGALQAELLLR